MKFPYLPVFCLALATALAGCQPNVSVDGNSVTQHITLEDGRVGANAPDGGIAWVDSDGGLRIDGEQVGLSARQRALALQYYAEALGLKADALAIAEAGKDMATVAVSSVVTELLAGNPDGIDGKVEAEARKIEASAMQLCRRVDSLHAAQEALALEVPAFASYATIEENEDDCQSRNSADAENSAARLSGGDATSLVEAVKDGRADDVRQLVSAGVDVDAQVRGDGTALIMAARHGNLEIIDLLIELGADPDHASRGDGNPLIIASMTGHAEAVERLLDAGADANAIVPYDETALINAAREGHLDIVTLLVEQNADVNLGVEADFGQWRSPLNQARDQSIRAYLVSQGAVERSGT